MAQIICVLGNKSGTGKTTISHMLGQGLGLLGLRTVVAVTDETRERLAREVARLADLELPIEETPIGKQRQRPEPLAAVQNRSIEI